MPLSLTALAGILAGPRLVLGNRTNDLNFNQASAPSLSDWLQGLLVSSPSTNSPWFPVSILLLQLGYYPLAPLLYPLSKTLPSGKSSSLSLEKGQDHKPCSYPISMWFLQGT